MGQLALLSLPVLSLRRRSLSDAAQLSSNG